MFCSAATSHAPIAIINFSTRVEKLFANDKYGFSEEYKVNSMFYNYNSLLSVHIVISSNILQEIQETSPKHENDCFSMPVNKQKNRYQNIVCCKLLCY